MVGEVSGYLSGLFGLGLATYTGVLTGNTVVPLWKQSRRILPPLFAGSAMASAASLFDMMFEHHRATRITYTYGLVGRSAELAAGIALERKAREIPAVARPLSRGWIGLLWRGAAALTAASLVTMLLPRQTRRKRLVAGALGTAGSVMMRFAVHHAGAATTRDPRAAFHQQRAEVKSEPVRAPSIR